MTGIEQLAVAGASVLTGMMSLYVGMRRLKSDASAHHATGLTAHTSVLVEGFGGLVEQLQDEVKRLNEVISDMRREQDECERRNDEMAVVIEDLKRRIGHLEANGHGSDVP